MKTKLILVEGIPGSGKSTIAKKIAAFLKEKGLRVKLYNEGDLHPADLAWHAVVPNEQVPAIKSKYSELWPQIEQQMSSDEQYTYIAYSKVQTENYAFYADMQSYEVYDNRKGPELFDALHLRRWKDFGAQVAREDSICIFECAFMQNHIGELLFSRNETYAQIQTHMRKLICAVKELNPLLIYLSQPDIGQTISRVGEARYNEGFDWLKEFVSYSENTPYAKAHNLQGLSGAIAMQAHRKQMEIKLVQNYRYSLFCRKM